MNTHRSMHVTALALAVLFSAGFASRAVAQGESSGSLPEGLSQLPPDEFVAAAMELRDDNATTEVTMRAIGEHAASLLAQYDFLQIDITEYPLVEGLQYLGRRSMDDDTEKRLRHALLNRDDDWTDRPYEEIRGKIAMMWRLKLPFQAYSEARAWIDGGGNLTKIAESERGAEDLQDPHAPVLVKLLFEDGRAILGGFHVEWNGFVTVPQSGAYRFSISPINTNGSQDGYTVRQSMTVKVGGEVVISATPEEWDSESDPVTLTAAEPTEISVELDNDSSGNPRGALHAILSWQGPGVAKSIIPAANLTPPEGEGNGLLGTYTWVDQGTEKQAVQLDPTIDFAWPLGGLLLSGSAVDSETRLLQRMLWEGTTNAESLDAMEQTGEPHPLLRSAEGSSANLTSAQRREFLQILLARPSFVDVLDPMDALVFYRAYRFGAEEEALDVFGLWAARRANQPCAMSDHSVVPGIDGELRAACRRLAISVTQELPDHAARLQDRHLELSDGTCSLPIAYALAYSYESVGRLPEWVEYLEGRLADESLTGDKRVNWLIARAHAHEIRLGHKRPYVVIKERVMDGRGWLDEAMLVAESPATKARVAKEIAARLAMVGDFDAARDMLDQVASEVSGELAENITAWRQSVDTFEAALAERQAARAEVGEAAYLATLKRRRETAAASGDQEAVSRYDALIQSVESE